VLEVGSHGRLPLGVFEERHKGTARYEAGGQARGLLLLFHASAIGALELRFSPGLLEHRGSLPDGRLSAGAGLSQEPPGTHGVRGCPGARNSGRVYICGHVVVFGTRADVKSSGLSKDEFPRGRCGSHFRDPGCT